MATGAAEVVCECVYVCVSESKRKGGSLRAGPGLGDVTPGPPKTPSSLKDP